MLHHIAYGVHVRFEDIASRRNDSQSCLDCALNDLNRKRKARIVLYGAENSDWNILTRYLGYCPEVKN